MRRLLGLVLGLGLAACGDSGSSGPVGSCDTAADCPEGLCVSGRCEIPRDGGTPDAGASDAGEADGGICETAIFCGTPPVCCDTGTECVEGACLPLCETGVRCAGACCGGSDDVCIDGACTAPGEACGDNFDCPPAHFCEPTLERCLPQFDPITCETEPVLGDFEVTAELSLTESENRSDCFHPISSPIVLDINGDETPDIVSNMACDDSWSRGALRAFDGATGDELWVSPVATHGRISVAAGDLDGSGNVVIVTETAPGSGGPSSRRAVAFDGAGNELWQSTNADGSPLSLAGENTAPTLADLDGDGRSEILWGAVALDREGRLLWQSGQGANEGTNNSYTGGISVVGDIDGDGLMDVVTGKRAYERDGTLKWEAMPADGYPALAQFDEDAAVEVVLVGTGQVSVLDGADGSVQWGPVALPGGGRGGPPTVADFDGDGQPEIGVAGAENYVVFDPSGESDILWSRPTTDQSSNATGSSVFDFEGDGSAEVVYQDECAVWVYRGTDGTVLLQIPSSSATIHEYPLVVDVDGDGNSELVTVANNRGSSSTCPSGFTGSRRGIFVYGDARDQWVRTRRIWNQHAYNVTNVGSAGEIPAVPRPNWEVPELNNFRQNAQGEAAFNAPDLQVGLEARLDGCPDRVTLRARVVNEGNLGVEAGVVVVFYDGEGMELARAMTTGALLPGASEVLEAEVALPTVEGGASYRAVVDGAEESAVVECREDNNTANLDGIECELLI